MSPFRLKIWHVEQTCIFELSWGKGQQLTTRVPFAETLKTRYHHWRQTYLDFYSSQEFHPSTLRARIDISGSMTTPAVDWRARLVQAEAELTTEFHHWLSVADLLKIRQEIASSGQPSTDSGVNLTTTQFVDVFLTCDSLELERLPWETWEIGMEFATQKTIRFVRTPSNIAAETVQHQRQGKMRILAILGDDTGLNFQAEKQALREFATIAEVVFQGWQPGIDPMNLLEDIRQAIAAPQGWDILFFAGHSNETNLTGGELAIAPNQAILVNEIAPQLSIAKERGLKFAIFNSCQGLSIANTLINLGLSQVAIMREPIHNQVAQEFFVHFLRQIANYQDVQEALRSTCQWFKLEKNLTYPSAYLIPSLFRHPNSVPFRLKPSGWREQLKQWLPTKREAIALTTLVILSTFLPVQNWLLERRVLTQAIYRQLTGQLSTASQPPVQPPVLLVQIDEESILKDKINPVRPISRPYLAQLIAKLVQYKAQTIGIDYLLHRYENGNDILAQAIRNAVENHQTRFIFATTTDQDGVWQRTLPEIANPAWSLEGDMDLLGDPVLYTRLIDDMPPIAGQPQLPFSYLLALAYQLNNSSVERLSQSQLKLSAQAELLNRNRNRSEITHYLNDPSFSSRSHLNPMTAASYRFSQMWLHPLIDYSIPPWQVYDKLSAYQLSLDAKALPQLQTIAQQVVIVAPGGHLDAGVLEGGDNFFIPLALQYWHSQKTPPDARQKWTGGEIHAYMMHNILNHRLIIPIPDVWLIGLMALCGKGTVLYASGHRRRLYWLLFGGSTTIIYGAIILQTYITAGILLPWLFPTATLWIYLLPILLRNDRSV
jgi:CHASE2 domain-containing sensor protein